MDDLCKKILSLDIAIDEQAARKRAADAELRKLNAERVETAMKLKAEMEESGVMETMHGHLAFQIRQKPRGVIITDEAALPDKYIEIVRKVKKSEINKDVKAGVSVPGASLDNGGTMLAIVAKRN